MQHRPHGNARRHNLLAVCITVFSVVFLYANFDPVPAGENTVSRRTGTPPGEFLVPLPPDASVSALPTSDITDPDKPLEVVQATPQGCLLSNMEAIQFSLLLLKDGERFLKNIDTYTAAFHKKERVGGDLLEPQTTDLKIQHTPHFAVHMQWRNGDKGRQVLYSDEYEDGSMVVKLGGFRGRLLPAIKLDPNGSKAKSESRYPVTQAGILGMLTKIIARREADLKHGHGVECTRLPDAEFDERKCYCFQYIYTDRDVSSEYRKCIVLIDSRYHIPMMVRNFTWADDTEGMDDEELDQLTLIEDYAFTEIDFSRKLVAIDFSRDNPKYRM